MITEPCRYHMSQDLHTPSWVCQRATHGDVVVKPGPNTTAAKRAAIAGGLKRWSTGRPLRRKLFHLSICMLGSTASDRASNPAENHHDGQRRRAKKYRPAPRSLSGLGSAPSMRPKNNSHAWMREDASISDVGGFRCSDRMGSVSRGWLAGK